LDLARSGAMLGCIRPSPSRHERSCSLRHVCAREPIIELRDDVARLHVIALTHAYFDDPSVAVEGQRYGVVLGLDASWRDELGAASLRTCTGVRTCGSNRGAIARRPRDAGKGQDRTCYQGILRTLAHVHPPSPNSGRPCPNVADALVGDHSS